MSFAASLHQTTFTLYVGQSADCSPTCYKIGYENWYQSNNCSRH